ncbi:MAG: glycosyl hydrolase family 2 protein [Saccharofermentanales bacterium]
MENEKFKNPGNRYALFPIIHAGIAGNPANAQRLDSLGFAGVVGNIPYGPGYPDDKDEWEKTARGFHDYIDRGMHTWIYDEKGYPSGSAGGVVIDRNPGFTAVGLYCYEYWRTLTGPMHYRADVPADKLFKALLLPLDNGEAIDVTRFLDENDTLRMEIPAGNYHLFMMSSRRLFDGTHAAESYSEPRDYINICDKEATEAFIKVTHEKYAEILSDEFGKGVMAFFTDEPSLISWNIRNGVYPIVPWHREFPEKFGQKYGYPVELAVSAVISKRGPEMIKRRCDFWEFIGDTVAENFFGTIQNWCREHRLKSSGHMLEEERLQAHVYNYGSMYKCGRRMDWPGIDQLRSEPQELMDINQIPIARLLASFADINGEGESFTEFSDFISHMQDKQIGMNWIRGSVNWHYAMGINNLTSYYNFENFIDDEIRNLNLYAARLGYMIRQGKRDSRVGVLYPEAAMWAAYTPSVETRAIDSSEDTILLDKTFAKISWELLHRQIDFDYIDEELINEGLISDGKLIYRDRMYECVILPAANVLSISTIDKMVSMMDAGIGIVIIGDLPKIARDTGADEGFYKKLSRFIGTDMLAVIPTATGWTLPGMKRIPAIPRPVTIQPHNMANILTGPEGSGNMIDGEIISAGMLMHTRILEDGSRIVFLTNMGGRIYSGSIKIAGGQSISIADPFTGMIEPVKFAIIEEFLIADIKLRPYEGFCYIIG